MTPIDAVCFGLDGTLCVPERSDGAFLAAVADRAGVDPPFSPADLRATDADDVRREADGDGADDITGFYAALYRATVRRIDADVDPGDPSIERLATAAGDLYDPTAVTARAGARETLGYVRERHDLALVTNGRPETQRAKLRHLGIADAFDATVFCDGRAVARKPAPDPFERVLSTLSVAPERAVAVGDSLADDVRGARRAGLQSVWVPTDRPHEDPPADPEPEPTRRAASLADLRSIL